jgi:hypothetical protein
VNAQHAPKKEVPKSGSLSRLKLAHDSIPTIKPPQRQISSRFHSSGSVELERLPGLHGKTHVSA